MTIDSRKIYVCMDYGGSTTYTEIDTVVSALKNAGFNAERSPLKQSGYSKSGVGPSCHTDTVRKYCNNNNVIVFSIMNGSDAGIFREIKVDNQFKKFRSQTNNTICLGFYNGAGDFYNTDGKYYKWLVRAHDDDYSPSDFKGLSYPKQYLFDAGIPIAWGMNNLEDGSTYRAKTLNTVIKQFIYLFTDENWKVQVGLKESNNGDDSDNDSDDNSDGDSEDTTEVTTTTKTVVTEKTYTKAYFQKVLTATTDQNGAFAKSLKLPYAGEYTVDIRYGGNGKTYAPSTRTITIKQPYGTRFSEQLVKTVITTTDTSGNTTTTTTGSIPENSHTYTKITTNTYDNGKLSSTTTTTRDNDTTIISDTDNTDNTTDTDTNTNTSNTSNTTNTTNKEDPFQTPVAVTIRNTPHVDVMSTTSNGVTIGFKWINFNQKYTMTKDHYKAVMDMDSQWVQLKNIVPRYTVFQCTEYANTYIVIQRENWNAIYEAIMYYMVQQRGGAWPSNVVIDFNNKKIECDGTEVSMKSKTIYHIGVRDRQNTGHSCGPTAMSMCTQFLYHYYSEQYWIKNVSGGTSGNGTAPSAHQKALNSHDFNAIAISNWGMTKVKERLSEGAVYVGHYTGHYIALVDYNPNTEHYLILNSAGSSSGPNGWVNEETAHSAISRGGSGEAIYSSWKNLTEERKTALTNFYISMGGQWKRTFNESETIRAYK